MEREKEVGLWRKAIAGDVSSQHELVNRNLGLVRKVIKSFPKGEEYLDYFQEGVLWLCDAIYTFDPTRGTKFDTHATWRIREGLQKYCREEYKNTRRYAHPKRSYANKPVEEDLSLGASLSELKKLLGKYMRRLPKLEREALRIFYFSKKTFTDVALKYSHNVQAGVSVLSIRKKRAMKRLEKMMGEELDLDALLGRNLMRREDSHSF